MHISCSKTTHISRLREMPLREAIADGIQLPVDTGGRKRYASHRFPNTAFAETTTFTHHHNQPPGTKTLVTRLDIPAKLTWFDERGAVCLKSCMQDDPISTSRVGLWWYACGH
jgi:hypothetical protein